MPELPPPEGHVGVDLSVVGGARVDQDRTPDQISTQPRNL
jgi:hypothetical protein